MRNAWRAWSIRSLSARTVDVPPLSLDLQAKCESMIQQDKDLSISMLGCEQTSSRDSAAAGGGRGSSSGLDEFDRDMCKRFAQILCSDLESLALNVSDVLAEHETQQADLLQKIADVEKSARACKIAVERMKESCKMEVEEREEAWRREREAKEQQFAAREKKMVDDKESMEHQMLQQIATMRAEAADTQVEARAFFALALSGPVVRDGCVRVTGIHIICMPLRRLFSRTARNRCAQGKWTPRSLS